MPIGLLKEIIEQKPQNIALMGLDVGKKTLGIAISDPAQNIAMPLKTINRTKFSADMNALKPLIKDYEIGGFVLGLPINMDGAEGRKCQSIRDFAAEMSTRKEILGPDPWLAFWDERLSTETVETYVDELVEKRKTKVKSKPSGLIDKLAAQLILQGALDFINHCP